MDIIEYQDTSTLKVSGQGTLKVTGQGTLKVSGQGTSTFPTKSSNTEDNQIPSEDVLHKAEIMALNNGWNDKNEQIIISIGENSASYKWMHEKCAGYHKFVHKFTSILLIILSTVLSAETIIPNNDQCNSDFTLDIIRRVFVYMVTVLSVIQNFLKLEETSGKHLFAVGAFSNLYHDIQQQMCMFRRDRVNATKYVSECLKQYDSLVITSPDISSRILMKFKNTFKNSDIALPEIADKIQKIEIITEDPMQSNLNINNVNNVNNVNNLDANDNVSDVVSNSGNLNIASFNLQKRIKRKGVPLVLTNKQSSVQNCNNLAQIHNAFQIHGDISDKDLENIDSIQLRELRNRFLQEKSDYEFQRFLQHSHEDE